MATAEIRVGSVMGGAAPVYNPARASDTLTTTTSNAVASLATFGGGAYTVLDGDFVRVTARGAGQYVAISKVATSDPRDYIPDGGSIDIGPLKAGDTINVADVA